MSGAPAHDGAPGTRPDAAPDTATTPVGSAVPDADGLHAAVLAWFDRHERDLPWRRPGTTPWGVFVSEIMSHQTPVARVAPIWQEWLERWPTPAALAAAAPGEAVRHWGRLGYPRRALRLHEAAQAMVDRHDGAVPASVEALLALPGVGPYTAAAVAAFAFGVRTPVVDTNVRRVQARAVTGVAAAAPALTRAETALAADLLPSDRAVAARWNVAIMELGALVCTAARPHCAVCPIRDRCAWLGAGAPPYDGPARRGQRYAGTDRQVRGRLLSVLRDQPGPATRAQLDAVWSDAAQRERCLVALVEDGLVDPLDDGRFALPR